MSSCMNKETANQMATGAPGTIDIGGETYLVGQPTDADFITVRRHLSKIFAERSPTPLAAVVGSLEGLTPQERAIVLKEATAQQPSGAKMTDEAMQELLFDPEGASVLAWVLIRKNHPEIKLSELRKHVNEDNVDLILESMFKSSGLSGLEKNGDGRTGSRS